MAAAIAPTSCLRFSPQSAARYISVYISRTNPNLKGCTSFTRSTLATNYGTLFRPYHCQDRFFIHPITTDRRRRCFSCSAGAETIDKSNDVEHGEKVRKFRKRLRIADVKGGPDEGLDRLGQKIVVKGWVRTLRAQSTVTFLEVNDGSCLSNMQCILNSDAEGYDQVESGFITTGASVWVEGVVVISQGSKQKVELNVATIITVGRSDPSFPIQKKRVSREFLRTKAHLRPRTNTFGAVLLPKA